MDNSWAILCGGTILAVQAMSTDQAVLQKYFTTKSARETSKSLLFYGAVIIPLMTLRRSWESFYLSFMPHGLN